MYWLLGRKSKLYKQQTPHLRNYTQTNLDLWNTTLGDHVHVQHRNPRTLSIEGPANSNGSTMVCAEYDNTGREKKESYPRNRPWKPIGSHIV
jgi:hypothetical protein